MRAFGIGTALAASEPPPGLGAAPGAAKNQEWVMEGSEYPEGKVPSTSCGDGEEFYTRTVVIT